MHEYNLLVCLFICVCIAVIIMAVVCEYFTCPTAAPLNVDPYLYYYTIIWIFLFLISDLIFRWQQKHRNGIV